MMGKLSRLVMASPAATSPVTTKDKRALTEEGALGYLRKPKSELFLLAVSNMVGEDTFYEGASERDQRFRALVHTCTVKDPDWVARFVPYLRDTLQMRTASVVMAAESTLARLEHRTETAGAQISIRTLVASALQRPDEPGEFLAYWTHRTGKHTLPGGVQRGVADAVTRLFHERAAVKYDGTGGRWRLGDVIELTHPTPSAPWQSDLFRYLLDRRHHSDTVRVDLEQLPVIRGHRNLTAAPKDEARAELLADPGLLGEAGVTWEFLGGLGPMDAAAWQAVIPQMGFMALLRNLRNFDEAGIDHASIDYVNGILADPDRVAKSRQLPMRFLSAYKATNSLHWASALERALNLSLASTPSLPGRTLILLDLSGSMWAPLSARSELQRWEAAAVFACALALRAENPTLVRYGSHSEQVPVPAGGSVLRLVQQIGQDLGGTDTVGAIGRHYTGHDRVVLLTDEQATGYYGSAPVDGLIPASTWLHTFNLAGYRVAGAPSGTGRRATFGGLTDRAFQMIPLLERGESQDWPF